METGEAPAGRQLKLITFPFIERPNRADQTTRVEMVTGISVVEDGLGTVVEVTINFNTNENQPHTRRHRMDPDGTFYSGNATSMIKTEREKWASDLTIFLSALEDQNEGAKILTDLQIQ